MASKHKHVINAFGCTLAHDLFDPRERDAAGRAPLLLEAGTWLGVDQQLLLWEAGFTLVEVDLDIPQRDHA